MVKKLIGIAVIAMMLFWVFGLTACNLDNGLADYKAAGKGLIDAHAATKIEADYCTKGWEEIYKAVIDGKVAVDAASTKSAVDTAVTTAKTAINAVAKEEVGKGRFYTLQEAFNEGSLTRDNLMHISHFATGKVVEVLDATENIWENELWLSEEYWTKIKMVDFTPQQVKPSLGDLSSNIIAKMKISFYEANQVLIDGSLQSAISDGTLSVGTTALETIMVQEFLGAYNGFYAVRITSTLWGYGGATISQLVSDIGWSLSSAPMITVFTI